MAETASIRGSLVGWERRPYGSFTDRDTGEIRPGGETLWLYVSAPNGEGPTVEVKVREAVAWEKAVALGFGASVRCVYQLSAMGNTIRRQLVQIDADDDETPAAVGDVA